MNLRKWLVPGLFIIGSVLIAVSIWGPQSQIISQKNELEIAYVPEKSGTVTLQNNEIPSPVPVKVNTTLHARDTIRTDSDSDLVIQFKNEGQFRMTEKSEVLIDTLDNGSPLVVIRSGEIYIEKFGQAPSFWVRSEGQLLTALDFALAHRQNLNQLKEPIPEKIDKSQLSQFEIESLLNSKKTDFFKCYSQVLQKNAQARGQILISFTIQKQGQTSKIEVTKSDINDNTFKSCLMEVVARTQFTPFTGAPITTVFPLKFE